MEKTTTLEHIVAIGASAGGLTPLQELVDALPETIDDMAIIIAQHLSPEYKSMLTEIISRRTVLKTVSISDKLPIIPNHIFITPPNCDVVVKSGRFEVIQGGLVGPRPSIDKLFTSLASEYKDKATGIILSGTGQDGSKGVVELKKAGGLTICQDLESSKYSGMPQASMTTGMIDAVLTPRDIGENLLSIIYNGRRHSAKRSEFTEDEKQYEVSDDIKTILRMLEAKIGTDFNNYKESTIVRRLEKRLHDKHFPNVSSYLNYVRENEDELEEFFKYLLIGVTYFFRDKEAFEALKNELRELIKKKDKSQKIRVWIPGCATGEESVSLAIIVNELIEETKRYDLRVQIFATDINKTALRIARLGIYDAEKVAMIPKKLLKKYFVKTGDDYEVIREIKQIILYTKHDLTMNPPFLRLDVISCRNLFIYFKQRLQNHIFPIFQYALQPEGILFLGKSETIGHYKNIFTTLNSKYRIFSRKERLPVKSFKLPPTKPLYVDRKLPAKLTLKNESLSIHEMVRETIYNTFEDPYVIIDENMDIIEVSGDVSDFLKIKPGLANINLLRMIIEDLHIEVRALTMEAIKSMRIVRGALKRYKNEEGKHLVRVVVKPLVYSNPKNPHFIVIFESFDIADPFFLTKEDNQSKEESQRNQELEYELISNKQHMNTLVQELETTNEELQALNEELQSSNEELQASNEELETSNEELQATNEELENAYSELRTTSHNLNRQKQLWEQLTIASPDTIAILRGNNYVIDFINPACRELFQNKDLLGQSIVNVTPKLLSKKCLEHLNHVRVTGKTISGTEHPVVYTFHGDSKNTKRFFNFTFAALHSEESDRNDIIIYAVDVTDQVNSRLAVENSAKFFSTLAESMPQMVWTINEANKITYINQTLRTHIGYTDSDYKKLSLVKFIHKKDKEEYEQAWQRGHKMRKPFLLQVRLADQNGIYRWHLIKCFPLFDDGNNIVVWICTSTDIHDQKLVEEKKDEFMSIASHELKTPLTTVKAYVELLEEVLRENDVETAALYVSKASGGLNKINSLVEDLLDMTRIQTGKLKFNKKKLAFDKLVEDTLDYMKPLTSKHKIIVTGKTNATILGDENRLEQVMINLISNAIKYSKENEEILINTYRDDGHVTFEVVDFGPGVPEQFRKKIFERFYRVKEKDDFAAGLGIGLYISKQIIRRHNGRIDVTSHDRQGSRFFIKLPVASGSNGVDDHHKHGTIIAKENG